MNNVDYYLQLARTASIKSKCLKKQVGCVIVNNGRVVSTGYNGHPRNTTCDNICLRKDIKSGEDTHIGYCCHAEMNALIFSNYDSIQGGDIYITEAPCIYCTRYVMQAGVKNCYYIGTGKEDCCLIQNTINSSVNFVPVAGLG